jgi:hypothetical protein
MLITEAQKINTHSRIKRAFGLVLKECRECKFTQDKLEINTETGRGQVKLLKRCHLLFLPCISQENHFGQTPFHHTFLWFL